MDRKPATHDGEHPLYNTPLEKWAVFFLVSMGTLTLTYGFLFLIDLLPEKPGEDTGTMLAESAVEQQIQEQEEVVEAKEADPVTVVSVDPDPIAIIFDSLDKEVKVLNPDSRNVADLDRALLSGVVRHPDSADFENEGTIFLFGHSSYLPKVINKNFQAFNGVQDLKWGDTIRLRSTEREYVYRVDRVYEVSATDAEVRIERGTPKLTLATCNTFGAKSDRYIVEATLIDDRPL